MSETDRPERRIELLTLLANGCKKHPAYRAIRPATGRCAPCQIMWQARLELNSLALNRPEERPAPEDRP